MANARAWPIFRALQGWRPGDFAPDALAGLTLAAIAVPEQMATARLGGFGPETGFLALIAGAVGFAAFGANRRLSVGADSTITPIFAGALAYLGSGGAYAGAAALLAALTGMILIAAGALRIGFVADLLSIPVTTGFLAGVALHIVASQLPAVMGVAAPAGPTPEKLWALALAIGATNPWTAALGLGVAAALLAGERLAPRFPSALAAIALATTVAALGDLGARGVATLGPVSAAAPRFAAPPLSYPLFRETIGLAALVAVVIMMQTAATSRAFVSDPARGPDIDRDFVGLGAANVVAALIGAFPVNASPPRTAVVAETGGRSQAACLTAAALALGAAWFGGAWLSRIPQAALAGVLLFVAQRIVRVSAMADIARRAFGEFLLILVTFAAIVALPIEQGVAVGVGLSILHGLWTVTRAKVVEYERLPGGSIWWPKTAAPTGETVANVRVVGLQAPLSFLNAYAFANALTRLGDAKLLVIEANALVEIDYTGAILLKQAIAALRARGVEVAVARLESLRAQASFVRHGLVAEIGEDHIFHSVDEAVRALGDPQPSARLSRPAGPG